MSDPLPEPMPDPMPEPPRSLTGFVYLSDEGTIDGWCQYQEAPDERVTVELLANGIALRAMRATRLRLDRREIGMGDGYCGFSFPFPPAPEGEDQRLVLDVREKRGGVVIGRVVLGDETVAMNRRLDAIAAKLSVVGKTLAAAPDHASPAVAATGSLGQTLLELSGRPAAQRTLGMPGLQAAQAQIAAIAAQDLVWHPSPDFSVIVCSHGTLGNLATQLIAISCALAGLRAEILLLDDGQIPAAALLPTRLRHLALVPAAPTPVRGPALNAAAAAARGKYLVFTGPGGPALASLREVLKSARTGQLALAPGPVRQGVQCLVARDDFAALGGFEPSAHEHTLWQSFIAKADALNYQIVPVETARSTSARWV